MPGDRAGQGQDDLAAVRLRVLEVVNDPEEGPLRRQRPREVAHDSWSASPATVSLPEGGVSCFTIAAKAGTRVGVTVRYGARAEARPVAPKWSMIASDRPPMPPEGG